MAVIRKAIVRVPSQSPLALLAQVTAGVTGYLVVIGDAMLQARGVRASEAISSFLNETTDDPSGTIELSVRIKFSELTMPLSSPMLHDPELQNQRSVYAGACLNELYRVVGEERLFRLATDAIDQSQRRENAPPRTSKVRKAKPAEGGWSLPALSSGLTDDDVVEEAFSELGREGRAPEPEPSAAQDNPSPAGEGGDDETPETGERTPRKKVPLGARPGESGESDGEAEETPEDTTKNREYLKNLGF